MLRDVVCQQKESACSLFVYDSGRCAAGIDAAAGELEAAAKHSRRLSAEVLSSRLSHNVLLSVNSFVQRIVPDTTSHLRNRFVLQLSSHVRHIWFIF